MDAVHLVILFVASWRLMALILFDTGPFDVISGLRSRVGADIEYDRATFLGKLFQCPYCMSIWTATFLVCFVLVMPNIGWPVAYILAASGAAVLIEELR